MLEDEIPEGPGDLQPDEPREATAAEGETRLSPRPPSPLRIRIRRIYKSMVNKFGLARTYHGRPSGIPKSHAADFLADSLQPPPKPQTLLPERSVLNAISVVLIKSGNV